MSSYIAGFEYCCEGASMFREGYACNDVEGWGIYRCAECDSTWRCYPNRPEENAWVKITPRNEGEPDV